MADVERLARPEQFVGELGREELTPGAARPVQDHHRVVDPPLPVAVRRAERPIVDAKLRQHRTRSEAEPAQHHVATLELAGIIRLRHGGRCETG